MTNNTFIKNLCNRKGLRWIAPANSGCQLSDQRVCYACGLSRKITCKSNYVAKRYHEVPCRECRYDDFHRIWIVLDRADYQDSLNIAPNRG